MPLPRQSDPICFFIHTMIYSLWEQLHPNPHTFYIKDGETDMNKKKTVLLTGASGTMGWASFQKLYAQKDKYRLVLLLRGSKKNKDLFAPYVNDPDVRLVWGDLTSYEDVLESVRGTDIVLHVGGMVSPASDYFPKATMKTNVTAARNIVDAIKAQPNPDAIRAVYIGTVAQTGDRNPPIHWGRTGDPIKISVYDHYAISKTHAEKIFAESGLRYWVSLRQSGILHPGIFNSFDPIMYHVPLNGVLEWATVEDSANLMRNVCADDVPEEFWRGFYNIGSGEEYRLTNFEFESLLMRQLGIKNVKRVFKSQWFALRNFHGQWYADSDRLEELLHFRENTPLSDYFLRLRKKLPAYMKLARFMPRSLMRRFVLEKVTRTPIYGTMHWFKERNKERISAFFGSLKTWEAIRGWKNFKLQRPTDEIKLLSHGYDERKPLSQLSLADMQQAAEFRGGKLLSERMTPGDLFTPLLWECAHGHSFPMTPNLVLRGGHWCEQELPMPWRYGKEAKVNPFFAQVWYPLHGKDENPVYDEGIYQGYQAER